MSSTQTKTTTSSYADDLLKAQAKLKNRGTPAAIRAKAIQANSRITKRGQITEKKDEEASWTTKVNPWVVGLMVFIVVAGPVFQLLSSLMNEKRG